MFVKTLFIFSSLLHVNLALASGTGHCERNAPYNFTFNYSPTLTSPDQNKAGLEFPDAYHWDLGNGTYTAVCDTNESGSSFYFKGDSNGAPSGHAANWFILNNNLEYKAEIGIYTYLGGPETINYYTVPFSDEINNVSHGDISGKQTSFTSGSKGNISLYFRRPFVGKMVIPPTIIARTFASTKRGSYGASPMSTVTLTGTITVPQSCDINSGDVINVDFGEIASNIFKTQWETPPGFTPRRVDFNIKCSNISNGVSVSLEFNGASSAVDASAVKTDNNDIAVRLADTSNHTISVQGGELPVNFNYANQTGTSAMQLYPFNATGKSPATGKFNAQVNVTVDIQ